MLCRCLRCAPRSSVSPPVSSRFQLPLLRSSVKPRVNPAAGKGGQVQPEAQAVLVSESQAMVWAGASRGESIWHLHLAPWHSPHVYSPWKD